MTFTFSRATRALPAIVGSFFLLLAPTVRAALVYGLTANNTLLSFDSATPGATTAAVPITGLLGARDDLIGIDFRPANGLLYGLAQDLSGTTRVYTINPTTGAATLVSTLSVPAGSALGTGMDFNPVPDRLRIVNTSGQNLRVNVDTGVTTVDSNLSYAPGDPHFNTPPAISAAAYANNVPGALTTQLYYIDPELNILVTTSNPNGGFLTTVGGLGVSLNSVERVGLDILTTGGVGGVNTAFANLSSSGSPNGFYSINLTTGAATLVGSVGSGAGFTGLLEDIALAPAPGGPGPGPGPNVPLPAALLTAIPAGLLAARHARKARRHG